MRKRLFSMILVVLLMLSLCACSDHKPDRVSTFSILFIDVGQGDSALIECDGRYMLIDGGLPSAGDKVYQVLEERGIQHLDILAMSHLHEDHIGGLVKALSYATKIDKTICNSDHSETAIFRKVEHALGINGATIEVPHIGDTYSLGSAKIEVVDVASEKENDSLVLLIQYRKTKFLFTGDIETEAQDRICQKYQNEKGEIYKIDLIKVPHHGAESSSGVNVPGVKYTMLDIFAPDYGIISVGEGNPYGHPSKITLDRLKQADVKVYRTDEKGDVIVYSDGESVSVEYSKK